MKVVVQENPYETKGFALVVVAHWLDVFPYTK